MAGMLALRVVVVALIAALIAGSALAQSVQGLGAGMVAIAGQPWGPATLLDLAAGLVVIALWMAVREPRRRLLSLWWVALLLLGNIATLGFVLRCTVGARSVRAVFLGQR